MKLILCFLMFIFSATSCWKQNAKPKVEHRQLNQKKVFSKDEKTDFKKDIYISMK